jgi:hypothetical protein
MSMQKEGVIWDKTNFRATVGREGRVLLEKSDEASVEKKYLLALY